MKKDIHPEWYPNAPVIVEGEVVMHVGATMPEIRVEIWSGTHPFYTGQQRLVDTEGQVDRFMRRLQRRQQIAKVQAEEEEKRDPLKLSINSMSLSTRYIKALTEAEVTTVGDIMKLIEENGDDGLLALSGIGQMAVVEIKRYLRAEGLIE